MGPSLATQWSLVADSAKQPLRDVKGLSAGSEDVLWICGAFGLRRLDATDGSSITAHSRSAVSVSARHSDKAWVVFAPKGDDVGEIAEVSRLGDVRRTDPLPNEGRPVRVKTALDGATWVVSASGVLYYLNKRGSSWIQVRQTSYDVLDIAVVDQNRCYVLWALEGVDGKVLEIWETVADEGWRPTDIPADGCRWIEAASDDSLWLGYDLAAKPFVVFDRLSELGCGVSPHKQQRTIHPPARTSEQANIRTLCHRRTGSDLRHPRGQRHAGSSPGGTSGLAGVGLARLHNRRDGPGGLRRDIERTWPR